MKKLLWIALLIHFFACVPRSKVIYLQSNDISLKNLQHDSTLKSFATKDLEYKLQSEDIISIKISSLTPTEYNFVKETEKEIGQQNPLLAGYIIDENGTVEVPVVGKVKLIGLTIKEAQEKIKTLFNNYLNTPSVYIRLLSFHVTILGEVKHPGKYTTYNGKINVMEAFGMAGDLTDFADRKNIKIIRYEDGNAKLFYVNALTDQLLLSKYYYLKPNDLIIVPPLKTKNFKNFMATNWSLAISTLTVLTLFFIRIN